MNSRRIRFTTPAGHEVSYFGVRHYVLIKDWPSHAVIIKRSDSVPVLTRIVRGAGAVSGISWYLGNCRTGGLALVHPSGKVSDLAGDPVPGSPPVEQDYQVRVYDADGQLAYSRVERGYSPMGVMIQLAEKRHAHDPRDLAVSPEMAAEAFGVPDPGCPTCYGNGTIWKQTVVRCPDCPGQQPASVPLRPEYGDPTGAELAAMQLPGQGGPLCGHRSRGRSECVMDAGHYAWPGNLHSDTILLWDDSGQLCNLNGQPIS